MLICGANNEGWCGGVYGCSLCVSKPLTNTNAGIKGQRRRRCSQLTHRLGREREKRRERGDETHTRTQGRAKKEGAPRLLGCTLHTELRALFLARFKGGQRRTPPGCAPIFSLLESLGEGTGVPRLLQNKMV